ncbi:hypothetical protein GCM10027056_12900 [Glaciibacter psychrotolerans]
MGGTAIAASSQKIDGRLFSERVLPDEADDAESGAGLEAGVECEAGTDLLSFEIEVRPEQLELGNEVFVATCDDSHVADG